MSSNQTTENVGPIVRDVDVDINKNKNFDEPLSNDTDKPLLNDKDKNWQQDKDLNYDKNTQESSLVNNVVEAAKSAGLKVRDAAAGAAQKVKGAFSSEQTDENAYYAKDKFDANDANKDKFKDFDYSYRDDKEAHLDTEKSKDADNNWSDNIKLRANNLMEKTKDAAQAIPERAKIMGHKVMDKAKNLSSGNKDSTLPTSDPSLNGPTVNVSDASGLTSESHKHYYEANTTANAADKAQDWISDTKQKFNQQVEKAQDLASDVKHKAQENKEPSATSSVYHDSSIRGDTY